MNDVTLNKDHLEQLAYAIRLAHEMATLHLKSGLQEAKRAGELLLEAKSRVKHGKWLSWLSHNCKVPERTAQAYMKVASNWEQLEKSATVADLTFREATKLLARPPAEKSQGERLKEMMQHLYETKATLRPEDPIDSVFVEVVDLSIKYAPVVFDPNATFKQLVHAQRCMQEAQFAAAEIKIRIECFLGRILNEAEKDGTKNAVMRLVNLGIQAEAEGCHEEFLKGIADRCHLPPVKPLEYPADLVEAALKARQRLKELPAA